MGNGDRHLSQLLNGSDIPLYDSLSELYIGMNPFNMFLHETKTKFG